MTEQILKLMAIAPGPQTAADLCDSLRRGGVKTEEFQLVEQLRRLQRDGFVRLEGIRWRLLKVLPKVSVTPNSRSQATLAPVKIDSQSAPSRHTIAPLPPVSPPQAAGRWALFRRMCRYYMDCLLQDEAPQLRAYVDN